MRWGVGWGGAEGRSHRGSPTRLASLCLSSGSQIPAEEEKEGEKEEKEFDEGDEGSGRT